MTFDLVLARKHEQPDWWIKAQVPKEYRVLIYDAGDPLLSPSSIQIPDAGVEAGAYCQHVLKNYESLADLTVFSQANPHDHHTGSIPMTLQALVQNPPSKLFFIGDEKVTGDEDILVKRARAYPPSPLVSYSQFPLQEACQFLFSRPCPKQVKFAYGAIYAVPKKLILSRSISFWDKLYKYVSHCPIPREGTIMERLWPLVFNGDLLP